MPAPAPGARRQPVGGYAVSAAGRDPDVEVAAAAGTWACQQAYKLGAEQERARLTDPAAGYRTGFDVGFQADTEHRDYVHAIVRGYERGYREAQDLAREQAQKITQPVRDRQGAELEAGLWPPRPA